MIFCIEGPDGAGKSSLAVAMRAKLQDMTGSARIRWLSLRSPSADLVLHGPIDEMQAREIELFASMYDPEVLYGAERFFAVSGPIYARVFERAVPDVARWALETHVFYLDAPVERLVQRVQGRGGDRVIPDAATMVALRLAYERQLFTDNGTASPCYGSVTRLDAEAPIQLLVRIIEDRLRRLGAFDTASLGPYDIRRFIAVQRRFNEELQRRKYGRSLATLSLDDRNQAIKDLILSTAAELFELLEHTNWKMHKRARPIDPTKLVEEYVDTLKFLLNFQVYVPIGIDTVIAEFYRKSDVVMRRLVDEYPDKEA
jgi:thymidylate kinase